MRCDSVAFHGPLCVTWCADGFWATSEPLWWHFCDEWGEAHHHTIPPNFRFNFASVPRIFWAILPPAEDRYGRAACIHDWLYATKQYPRELCDEIFLVAMGAENVEPWKREVMYRAVRWFGKSAYNAQR